jgi:hypothetical protein
MSRAIELAKEELKMVKHGLFGKTGIRLVILLFLVGACKDDDLKVDINVTNSNLCSEVAEVMCRNMFECCTGAQLETILGVEISTTEEACRNDQRLVCENANSALRYSIEQGRTSLDTSLANACLKELLVGDECFPQVSEFAPSCTDGIVTGNQAAGADCIETFECQAGSYCGADRKCRELPDVGEECSGECKPGLYCGVEAAATGPVCIALKAAGEDCNDSSECVEETFCLVDNAAQMGQCTAPKALGTVCENDNECDSGFCLPGSCGGAEECTNDSQCTAGTCRDSGASCWGNEDCDGQCGTSTMTCNADSPCQGTCTASGAACFENGDCGTCAVSGFSCTDTSDCDTTDTADVCETDTCTQEACNQTDVCEGFVACEGRVCAEQFSTVDYCSVSPLGQLM